MKRTRNPDLAAAVARDPRPTYKIAADSGNNPTLFSGFITGRETPSASQRQRIAETLGVPESSIFPAELTAATK